MLNFSIKSFLNLIKKHKNFNNFTVDKLCFNVGLDCLGEGSSRVVYALNNKCVIKIATSKAGLAQNRAEAKISNHPKAKARVARVLRADPNFDWIIAERVDKCLSGHAHRTDSTYTTESCFNYGFGVDFNLHEIEVGILNGRKVATDYGGTKLIIKDYY